MSDDVIHVLSIEDNPADALLIREKLNEAERVGWDLPHFAINHVDCLRKALEFLDTAGAETTEPADAAPIDVVLTDLDLPDSRAGETVATLRDSIPHKPLVVLTGREDEALARTSVRAGVQDYLYKNEATGSLLARTLMYAIERQQIHGELEQRVAARTAEMETSKQIAEHERDIAERYLNIAPSIIIALDSEGHISLLNKMGADILECDRDAVIGRNWFEAFIPERLKYEVRTIFKQLMAGDVEAVAHVEGVVLTGKGHERMIQWHNTLLRNEDGTITGLLSSGEDITTHRHALTQLEQNEAMYRQLIETLHEGIWSIDADGYTTFVNPRMADILGYTAEEMVGQHLFTFMDPAEVKKATTYMARRQQGAREQHEFEFRRKDGSRVVTLMGTSPLLNGAGHYQGALASVFDITARKDAEADRNAALESLQDAHTQQIEDLNWLTNTAQHLLALSSEDEILTFATRTLQQKLGNALVLMLTQDDREDTLQLRAIQGIDETLAGRAFAILGFDPRGMTFEIAPEFKPI
jgi:PAS domain S-box-containing protein